MKELARTRSTYERRDVPKAEAIEYFTQKGDPYKLELIDGLEDGSITFYTQGNFTDLCRGPHIPETGLRSEEHTTELQTLMRISYAVFCFKKKTNPTNTAPRQVHTIN